MKTKPLLIAIATVCLAACGKQNSESASHVPEIDLGDNPFFLTTELPQEEVIGTPVPIHIPGANNNPVPAHQISSPGIGRVIYREHQAK